MAGIEHVSNSDYSLGFCLSVGLLIKTPLLIQGEIAIVGILTPNRLKVNPCSPTNSSGDGMLVEGGDTWS